MQNKQGIHDAPKVIFSLELTSSLSWVLDEGNPVYKGVYQALMQGVAEILTTLDIPGIPVVQIMALGKYTRRADQPRWMRVSINGQLCRYSNDLLKRVRSYADSSPSLTPGVDADSILKWLQEFSNDASETATHNHETLVEFFSLVCLEILKKQPHVLLDLPQVAAYAVSLPAPSDAANLQPESWPPDPNWLYPILRKVLHLKISLAEKQTVANVLWTAQEQSQEDISEALIAALRPNVIEIHLSREYLRQLTTGNSSDDRQIFTLLREELLEELGIRYPPFRFVLVENLKSNSFAFTIHHLLMLPWVGIRPDQCLVNDTTSGLKRQNIQGIATSIPYGGWENSFIDSHFKPQVEAAGLATWNQAAYFKLCFYAELRQNSFCFVHRQFVQEQLNQMKWSFPALVDAVQAWVTFEQITRVLRALAVEGLSIRNLIPPLEHLLDYNHLVANPSKSFIVDKRLATYGQSLNEEWFKDPVNMISFLRTGMKHYISTRYARSTSTLVVYLLDPKIERFISEHISAEGDNKGKVAEEECDEILEVIRTEAASLPSTVQIPSILTSMDIRPFLREMIAAEFPRIAVLSYQELPTDINIQPVARLLIDPF